MASIKASFNVRKSGRLSIRKKEKEAVSADSKEESKSNTSAKDENNKKRSSPGSGKQESISEKSKSVMQTIKRVFSIKKQQSDSCSQEEIGVKGTYKGIDTTPPNSPVKNASPPYLTVPNLSFSPSSCTSFDLSPLKRTPDRLSNGRFASPEDIRKVSRRLLSPSKRKSDEENKNTDSSPSPPKLSCHGSTPSLRCSPTRSDGEPRTPKSSRRPNLSLSRTATSTPRRLFESPEKKTGNTTPLSPSKFCQQIFTSPRKSPNNRTGTRVYQTTKRCLHTAKPDRLIGREDEENQLEDFISERLEDKRSGSMYISGAPGTGKTAVVNHVIEKLKSKYDGLKTGFINCMTLKDSSSVFCALYEQLTGKPIKAKDSMKAMEKLFMTTKESIVLVLDEIDQLDSKHHEVLYKIFEWPALKNSRLILLGIANALDLTDRILPRLQASVSCRPNLMNFSPYTSTQITDILKNRLERDTIVEPSAINFCARKVSAVAGDIRKALDVCRRAVEMVESDTRSQQVLRPTDCNSPTKRNQVPEVKKVTITHISKVMSEVYGSSVTSANSTENDVPLQQKLAVCSLLVLVKNGKVKDVFLGKLHEYYSQVCRGQQMTSVDQSEFYSICSLLEARGIISMKKAKDTRLIKVSLKLDEQELEQTLKDKNLMAKILKDFLKS